MAASPGRIFTRDQLLARIWGYDYLGDGRTVDVHVSWLRGKLRGSDGHNYFRTVRGVGYAFAPRLRVTEPTEPAAFEALLARRGGDLLVLVDDAPAHRAGRARRRPRWRSAARSS